MSVKKRGDNYTITFRPFNERLVSVSTGLRDRHEAIRVEQAILVACRANDYRALDPVSREVCVRMFRNQKWEAPADLGGVEQQPKELLTFWKACELFLSYPEVKSKPNRLTERYRMCLFHLVNFFGKDRPAESIRVPDIKMFMVERLNQGASPSTVNWEKSTLSRLFTVLVELELVGVNPVRMVKNLSQKSEERQVYLSFETVSQIAALCPEWFRRIIWASYYTGMRRGELLGLTRKQGNLSRRTISLGPQDTKEGHWKRVPIHRDLAPILEEGMKVSSLGSDKVFLLQDPKGIRPVELEASKNPWNRACEALLVEAKRKYEELQTEQARKEMERLAKPWPRFHDLRATWKVNARRSGVSEELQRAIMGHADRGRSVHDRYGYISDQELLEAIDRLTVKNGETKIFVAKGSTRGVR